MTTMTLKLPKTLDEKLAAVAKLRRASKTTIVRQAVEDYLTTLPDPDLSIPAPTVGELVGHLAGCLDGGPPDLSTNKKYMEGYGE